METRLAFTSTICIYTWRPRREVDEISKRSKLEEFMDALPVLVKHSLAK
jgi:hypothetical protein